MIRPWTTYRDTRQRLWVITTLFYPDITTHDPDKAVGLNIYLVASDQRVEHLSMEKFKELLNERKFEKVITEK